MPRNKAGRHLRSWRLIAAMAVALPMIRSASTSGQEPALLPPSSSQGGPTTGDPIPLDIPAFPAAKSTPEAPVGDPPPSSPPVEPLPAPPQAAPPSAAPAASPPAKLGAGLPFLTRKPSKPAAMKAEPGPGTVDLQAEPAQAAAAAPAGAAPGGDPMLPPAMEPKGGAPAAAKPPGEKIDGFVRENDRLPVGRQSVGLSIDVVAPEVMNLNFAATLKLVVRNTGSTDVSNVRVRYDLPPELALVSSQPEPERVSPTDPVLQWALNTLAASSERTITLKVKAIKVAAIDHPAHVYVAVGSRARTVIQQPKLRVEMPNPTPSKVLNGQQVSFKIAVINDGDGPARNVEVAAKFSPGLKVDNSDNVGQTIPIIPPKQRIELDALIADTFAGGEQTCKVSVSSPDVAPSTPDMTISRSVWVTKPDLALKIEGPAKRYTDTLADYRLVVVNPGTAPAKNVIVTATLPPSNGRLMAIPNGAEWNRTTRRLQWVVANLDPEAKEELGFQVRLGGIGMYQVTAETKSGDVLRKQSLSTDVSGFADIKMEITERRRVLDVGESTVFDIKIKNLGTKDATNLKLSALISANLAPTETLGLDDSEEAQQNEKTGEVVFPVIPKLAAGRAIEISISARAKTAGVGTCKVFLEHDDIVGTKIEQFAHTTVTGADSRLK